MFLTLVDVQLEFSKRDAGYRGEAARARVCVHARWQCGIAYTLCLCYSNVFCILHLYSIICWGTRTGGTRARAVRCAGRCWVRPRDSTRSLPERGIAGQGVRLTRTARQDVAATAAAAADPGGWA